MRNRGLRADVWVSGVLMAALLYDFEFFCRSNSREITCRKTKYSNINSERKTVHSTCLVWSSVGRKAFSAGTGVPATAGNALPPTLLPTTGRALNPPSSNPQAPATLDDAAPRLSDALTISSAETPSPQPHNMAPQPSLDTQEIADKAKRDLLNILEGVRRQLSLQPHLTAVLDSRQEKFGVGALPDRPAGTLRQVLHPPGIWRRPRVLHRQRECRLEPA
jgi:hypothetical protein